MIVSMIAAMGKNRVIGADNQMMWHLPLEYKYFKDTTMGHCIIMGRKNYEAIGRALPGRTNIIVSRQKGLEIEGCVVVNSVESAIEHARSQGETEVFITRGGQIYQAALDFCTKIYLTEVDFEVSGDVYFPEFNESLFDKKHVHTELVGEKNTYKWSAFVWQKR